MKTPRTSSRVPPEHPLPGGRQCSECVCLPDQTCAPTAQEASPSECAPGGGTYESPEVLNELDGEAEESGGHFCPFRLEESAGQKEMVVELILLKP